MLVRSFILDALNRLFRLRGMELRALTPLESDASMEAGLKRACQLVPEVASVIDVGAASGQWTRRSLRHFQRARHLLIEPLVEREPELRALQAEFPGIEIVTSALGETSGETSFHVSADLDGSGIYDGPSTTSRTVPLTTLDAAVARHALPGPYLVKLDTHGFELPILRGATRTLESASLLLIEAYNFQLTAGCLRFHELCTWLESHGFRVCDLIEPLRRPGDALLWQMDLTFARSDHPAFRRASYR